MQVERARRVERGMVRKCILISCSGRIPVEEDERIMRRRMVGDT
jgi:hypothetical protein